MADKFSRRDFLKVAGLFTLGTVGVVAIPGVRRMIIGDKEAENGSGYTVMTVADVLKAAPSYGNDVLLPNAKAVFGESGIFPPEDHVVLLPSPPVGQSLNIELSGFTNNAATKKKGAPTTFGIQIQRRSETNSTAITQDPLNNASEHVVRETNSASAFRPLISAATQTEITDQNMIGFGIVDSTPEKNGGEYPLLVCLVDAPDSILLISPETFWKNNGVNVDLPNQVKVSYSSLSYPASDEVK